MTTRTEPQRAYNFKLVLGNETLAHFTNLSGLEASIEAIRYREGGESQVEQRLPGRVRYSDVTLKYGLTPTRKLFKWFMRCVEGDVERKNVSIVLLDAAGRTAKLKWHLVDAWPNHWRAAALSASSDEVAIETVSLVFESLKTEAT